MRIVSVILSAGLSSRMGEFKPLLDVGGVPALARSIRAFKAPDRPVCVVTGHRAAELRPLIAAEGAVEAPNADYETGMFSSVQAGVRAAQKLSAEGILLAPVDCPLIDGGIAGMAARSAEAAPEKLTVACFAGKKGHPLFIPGKYFGEILASNGEGGLRAVTIRHQDELLRLETGREEVILDMDTPEGYRRVVDFAAGRVPKLPELLHSRRFILVRHGETAMHAGKMFIGQYDVPLSEIGLRQAKTAAERVRALDVHASAVYCSDLGRALTTAREISGALSLPLRPDERLREISLGSWDGRPIEEVKGLWAEDYAARGRDILGWKKDGESFYDVQYRVFDFLRSALASDASEDIVIVSHLGVMRCLRALIMGEPLSLTALNVEKGGLVILSSPENNPQIKI